MLSNPANCSSYTISKQTLHFVIDRPISECDPHGVNIGPTAVDFSMLPQTVLAPPSEARSLKQWAREDLSRFYREQGLNRR